MRPVVPLLLVALMVGVTMAGCIGNDDAQPATDAPEAEAEATETTGSVQGRVVTTGFEPVSGAAVAVILDSKIVKDATTSEDGTYVLNGVAPGSYRLRVTAVCCDDALRSVEVSAGQVTTVDLQLEPMVVEDAFTTDEHWAGFIACSVGSAFVGSVSVCGLAEDPNEDFLHEFEVHAGLEELVVGMQWEPVGGVSGEEFWLLVEQIGRPCNETYASVRGAGPLEVRVTGDDLQCVENQWDNLTEPLKLRFRVFAWGNPAGVVYQQPFDVYWNGFYHQRAPDEFSALPDA